MNRFKIIVPVLFILLSTLEVYPLKAQNYDLYGYFIYTIAKYTQWPADYESDDFIIGVYGDTPAMPSLSKLAETQKIRNNNIVLKKYISIAEIGNCDMLFLPANKSDEIQEILEAIEETSTLLITEKKGMALKGSCINLTVIDEKQSFEINKAAYKKQNLTASDELTKYTATN